MAKEQISYEAFIANVNPFDVDFVNQTHAYLLENGCTYKIEEAKSGHVVSYTLTKTKKVIINYVFRKSGLIIRIYGDHIGSYPDILSTLPENMAKAIEKAPVCKRLIDPTKCNSKCGMGYVFDLKDTTHKKCRYNSFMFDIKSENYEAIKSFLDMEIKSRLLAV